MVIAKYYLLGCLARDTNGTNNIAIRGNGHFVTNLCMYNVVFLYRNISINVSF